MTNNKHENGLRLADYISIGLGILALFGVTIAPSSIDIGNPVVFIASCLFVAGIGVYAGTRIQAHSIRSEIAKEEARMLLENRIKRENQEAEKKQIAQDNVNAEKEKITDTLLMLSLSDLEIVKDLEKGEEYQEDYYNCDPKEEALSVSGAVAYVTKYQTTFQGNLPYYELVLDPDFRRLITKHKSHFSSEIDRIINQYCSQSD